MSWTDHNLCNHIFLFHFTLVCFFWICYEKDRLEGWKGWRKLIATQFFKWFSLFFYSLDAAAFGFLFCFRGGKGERRSLSSNRHDAGQRTRRKWAKKSALNNTFDFQMTLGLVAWLGRGEQHTVHLLDGNAVWSVINVSKATFFRQNNRILHVIGLRGFCNLPCPSLVICLFEL